MKTKPKSKSPAGAGFTLGRRSFAKISAVEGIHLTGSMKKDFREFERKGLTAEKRRAALAEKYGTKR